MSMNEKKLAEAKQIAANTFPFLQEALDPTLAVGIEVSLSLDTYTIETLMSAITAMHRSGQLSQSDMASLQDVVRQLNGQIPPCVKKQVIEAVVRAQRRYAECRASRLFSAAMASPSRN